MEKTLFIIGILFLLVLPLISASQINSTNYSTDSVISSGGDNLSSSNYKTDTILGIISGNTVSTLYQQSLGFFTCTPYTCVSLGYECGNWSDGCGGILNCGPCASGWTCTAGICVEDVTPPGGGGAVTPTVNIALDPTEINLKLPVNREEVRYIKSVEQIIKVTNLDSNQITVNIGYNGLEGIYIDFKNISSLTLAGKETKSFTIVFTAGSKEDNFIGNIIVGNKQIPTSLDVGEFTLFDSNIIVLNKDYKVAQGSKLKTQVVLIPLGDEERLDVTLNYKIKDYDGEIYLTQSETLLVEKQITFNRNFGTGMLPIGKYIVSLELVYPNGIALSSAHFEVTKRISDIGNLIFYLIIAVFAVAILIIVLLIIRKRKQAISEE